jgi:haloalkane dehalogenase
MNAVVAGQGPNDVLMVHGNPTWSFYYHPLIRQLQSNYRCVAPDHVGCGWSDKPVDYPYTLDQHIANLVQVIDQVDLQRAVLVAHDWGGAIGLGALLERPERFRGIVLLNTAAFPPPFFPWRIRACRFPGLGKWAVQGLNVFARAAITMATARPQGLLATDRDGLLAPYDSWSNRTAIYRFVADIPTRATQPTWQTLARIESALPQLKMPKQLIWGMQDWCFRPECLDRFVAIWPDAKVNRLAHAGHYVMLDDREQVSELVRSFCDAL